MTKEKSSSESIRKFKSEIIEDHRPWGKFRAYPHQNAGSIKIIWVSPGASLSLQYHTRRSEFWIALDKGLEVTVGKKTWRPAADEEIFIPQKTPHRLRCVGSSPARIMEIWIGQSDESDIVRIDDDYGRS